MKSTALSFAFLMASALVPVSRQSAVAQTRYWPLEEGRRWELRSPSVAQPMVFEVETQSGGEYRVRWDNPWVRATFYFRTSGNRILLSRLDMGSGVADMPANTVYFDFDQKPGAKWSNAAGAMTVLSTSKTVKSPSGEYPGSIEIRTKGSDGGETFWTFAPGVGVVQFGQGRGAFLLASVQSRQVSPAPAPPSRDRKARPGTAAGPSRADTSSSALLVGVDCTPPPTEGYGAAAIAKRFSMGVSAGMTFSKIHPKWNDVESGSYKFREIESHAGLAADHRVPIYLGIRTIDTSSRSLPDAYKNWRWDDPRMSAKLAALLRAMAPKIRGEVRWVAVGNEVDQYFKNHRDEIRPYAALLGSIAPVIRELWPGALLSVNFTWEAAPGISDYRPITDLTEVASFTYYPLNPDFTVMDLSRVDGHFQTMVNAAGGRPLILQELGFPSGALNKSSEDLQAQFVEKSLQVAKSYAGRIIAVNYLWMSDLPDSVVNEFAKYYRLPNSDRFKSYLATMGMFDKQGRPKKAWADFRKNAAP